MTVVYLHIGTEKTGSTAIQEFLTLNQKRLAKHHICYPYFDVTYPNMGPKRNGHWLQFFNKGQEGMDTAARLMNDLYALAEKYPKILLTDESIWSNVGHNGEFWKYLKGSLAEKNIDLKVVVYLRRQDQYLYSDWAQRVKASLRGGVLASFTLQEFVGRQKKIKAESLDYRKTLAVMESVLGKENITVRVFERSEFKGKDHTIYSDYLDAVNIEHFAEYAYPEGLVNISFKGSVLEAKHLLNQHQEFFPYNQVLRKYLREVQLDMTQEGVLPEYPEFSIEDRRTLMKPYEEGNAFVAVHFLDREDGVLFRSRIEDEKDRKGEYTKEQIAEVYSRMIYKMILDLEKK